MGNSDAAGGLTEILSYDQLPPEESSQPGARMRDPLRLPTTSGAVGLLKGAEAQALKEKSEWEQVESFNIDLLNKMERQQFQE